MLSCHFLCAPSSCSFVAPSLRGCRPSFPAVNDHRLFCSIATSCLTKSVVFLLFSLYALSLSCCAAHLWKRSCADKQRRQPSCGHGAMGGCSQLVVSGHACGRSASTSVVQIRCKERLSKASTSSSREGRAASEVPLAQLPRGFAVAPFPREIHQRRPLEASANVLSRRFGRRDGRNSPSVEAVATRGTSDRESERILRQLCENSCLSCTCGHWRAVAILAGN
jgi:hypothetical protein